LFFGWSCGGGVMERGGEGESEIGRGNCEYKRRYYT